MSTSYIGTVLDDITDGLREVPALAAVKVFSGPVSIEETGTECIAFGDARLDDARGALGGLKSESWDIDGEIYVVGYWDGDTESSIRAARDRVLALFAEVETYLNDTYIGQLPDVEVQAGELTQYIVAEGRACQLTFTLTVLAHKNP